MIKLNGQRLNQKLH